jgi:hypothetical protein
LKPIFNKAKQKAENKIQKIILQQQKVEQRKQRAEQPKQKVARKSSAK